LPSADIRPPGKLDMMNAVGTRPQPTRIYRGWSVLLGAFTALLFAGIVHTSFGFFIVPVSEELEISRADTNNWLSMMSVGSALVAPFAGRLIDRFSVRLVMAIGGITLAASFIAMSQTSSVWLLLFLALPVAFGTDCAGALSASTVAARWFRRRRGRALMIVGIATTGSGVTLSPIVAYLVATQGWRNALTIMGLMCGAVVILMVIFLIRSWPDADELRDAGELVPAATEELRGEQELHEQRVWTFRQLVTNRNFLLLAFGTGLLFASDRTLLASVAPYLHDEGISLPMAGLLVSAITGSIHAGSSLSSRRCTLF
jgi:MFS family permease